MNLLWRYGAVVVNTVVSEQESRFETTQWPFCVEFKCSPHGCVGFLRVLRVLPPTVQRHFGH